MLRRFPLSVAPALVACLLGLSSSACRDPEPVTPVASAIEVEMAAHLDSRIAKHLGRIQVQMERQKLALW